MNPAAYNQVLHPRWARERSGGGEGRGGGVVSGADGQVWRPARRPTSLFDLRLLWRAGRSLDPVGLLLVQFLLLLDLQDQLLDFLALRLHPLLRKPLGQVHRQVEAGNRVLYKETKRKSDFMNKFAFIFLSNQDCMEVQILFLSSINPTMNVSMIYLLFLKLSNINI